MSREENGIFSELIEMERFSCHVNILSPIKVQFRLTNGGRGCIY